MREESGYYIWDKSENSEWLGNFFITAEFSCQCKYDDCKEQKASKALIDKLEFIRKVQNNPLRIHSGFRCRKHQLDIIKSGISTVTATNSSHELGDAADISLSKLNSHELLNFMKQNNMFYSYGIAMNFIHVDMRPLKDDGTLRIWNY